MKQVNHGTKRWVMLLGIDFIEYYARSMMDLADGKPVLDREGEHNRYFYKPIGTGVTIPPGIPICNYGRVRHYASDCR